MPCKLTSVALQVTVDCVHCPNQIDCRQASIEPLCSCGSRCCCRNDPQTVWTHCCGCALSGSGQALQGPKQMTMTLQVQVLLRLYTAMLPSFRSHALRAKPAWVQGESFSCSAAAPHGQVAGLALWTAGQAALGGRQVISCMNICHLFIWVQSCTCCSSYQPGHAAHQVYRPAKPALPWLAAPCVLLGGRPSALRMQASQDTHTPSAGGSH